MFRNLLERLKATPPWVWITIVLAAVGVVISFLIYRNGVSTSQGDTSGQTAGVNPGDTSGGYSPYGNGSSQYQPDYSTQSLLQQMVNLLQGLQPKPGTPAPSPTPTPSPVPTPTPPPPVVVPPGRVPGTPVHAPPITPHPVPTPAPAPTPRPRTASAVPARQQPDYVVGSVNHADTHAATQPHPGAVNITPHPLLQRQQGF